MMAGLPRWSKSVAWSLGTVVAGVVVLIGMSYWLFAPRTERFASYAQLRDAQLIEKGWIPAFLPQDAFDIVHLHDLDTNWSVTEYAYAHDAHAGLDAEWRPVAPESVAQCRKDAAAYGWTMRDGPQLRCVVADGEHAAEFLAVDAGTKRVLHWHTAR